MAKSRSPFFALIIFALLLAGGFFIGKNNSVDAKELIFDNLSNEGNCNLPWLKPDCENYLVAFNSGSQHYIKMTRNDKPLLSGAALLSGYDNYSLSFEAKAYGTSTGNFKTIIVNVIIFDSINDVTSKIKLAEVSPKEKEFENFTFDLSGYNDKDIALSFETPNADSYYGAAIYNIVTKGYTENSIVNQPPTAIATSSAISAEVDEEIIFDGRESSDSDGSIFDWLWDLAGWQIHASSTSYSFDSSGLKNILFWAIDNEGATSSPVSFEVEITSSTAAIAATSTSIVNPGDLLINEIYPAPASGEKEWVEIFNPASSTIDLSGLLLLNIDGGKFVTTTLSGAIGAGGYAVIEEIAGSLNNSGDTVVLSNGSQIISQAVYGDFSGKQGESWARQDDGSYAVTITPKKNAANLITAEPAKSSGGGGGYVSAKSTADIPAATTTATSIAATTTLEFSGKIIINEVLPDPADGSVNEFIELKNISTSTIDLSGCYLADNSKAKYVLKNSSSTSVVIEPQGFLVVKKISSKIALNNSGAEAVNLFDPAGELIDRIAYEAEKISGQAYAKNASGEWLWTGQPTPGSENVFAGGSEELAQVLAVAKEAVKKSAGKSAAINYGLIDWEKLPEIPAGSKVSVRGVVAALPGVLGSQYFYLASPAGGQAAGIQVYSYKKDFPELKIGDYAEVSGELSDSSAGRRLKTASKEQIKFLEQRPSPEPHPIALIELEDYESGLVAVSGTVLEISGRNIIIADGDDEIKVYINSRMEFKDIGAKAGDKISVAGIVGKTASGYRVMPRDLADIKVEPGKVQGDFAVSSPQKINSAVWYLGAIAAFLGSLVVFLWWKLKKKQ